MASLAFCISEESIIAAQWQAGIARVNITPTRPMWLSGYAERNKSAQGQLHELWAKALVLEADNEHRVVLLTMDLIGIDQRTSREVCRRIETRYGLPRAAVALCASHTHTGPVVGDNLGPAYPIDAAGRRLIDEYTAKLQDQVVDLVGEALDMLEPAQLSWGIGTATFAVNRRNNPEGEVSSRRVKNELIGPVDHDVPVLAVSDLEGNLRAVVSGYACHATVLNDYNWSGDWPGAAQLEIERRHPGVMALYWAGCGGDQNPLPRRSVELLDDYGRQFAEAVDSVLESPLRPIEPLLQTAYTEIELPFDEGPTREELQAKSSGGGQEARWAKFLLAQWDREGDLASSYPYPLQVWRLGEDLTWVFLGGEVVVDYAIRLKHELGEENTLVSSYANDVMGYIPSRRVLSEGGYEAGGSRIGYGLPALWDPRIEERIIKGVHEQVETVVDSSRAVEQPNSAHRR